MRDIERMADYMSTLLKQKKEFHIALSMTFRHFGIPDSEGEALASLIGKALNERKQFKGRLKRQEEIKRRRRELPNPPREPVQMRLL